ncbi:u37-Nephitoxin-Nsp1b_1 [Trichonephila clavata]|uniref:U37-Nephitoxin-Nsp1b_1 n=1 Tax=Trichonephila clavata TaxID=2740835 RepID=A0A8X6LJS5_TRICU|nr:u37-Nephitoxin-Nsp1b_1 [Trichonephila clavata]
MLKAILLLSLVALATCGLLGGFETVDVNDEEVVAAANHAAEGLSKQFSGKFHHKLAKVLKAKRQVVAGTNYQMDIIVGMTECKKDEVDFAELEGCEFQEGVSTYKKCTVLVFKDLNGKHKLVNTGCILASKKDL